MKKLAFTIQIVVLLATLPACFIAELKRDKINNPEATSLTEREESVPEINLLSSLGHQKKEVIQFTLYRFYSNQ